MKNFRSLVLIAGIVMLTVMGCSGTPPTRFYILSPSPDLKGTEPKTGEACPTIGVGPVDVPAYLARPQMATTASENEIGYAPFDQWAQPLADNFSLVLAENVSKLVCNRWVYRFPWTGSDHPNYRVRVEVISMTGRLGKEAIVDVRWTVSDTGEKKVIRQERARYTEPVPDNDYSSLARAYSAALASLSKDIAKALPAGRQARDGPRQTDCPTGVYPPPVGQSRLFPKENRCQRRSQKH